jgi:hypothetical protein
MEEDLAEIEEHWDDYVEFKKMDSHTSFLLMEEFTDELPESPFQKRLIDALNKPKPFRRFKDEVESNKDYRIAWFTFKKHKMMEWVKSQLASYNAYDPRKG